ncbi:DUF6334 family protein [Microbulbifer sp. ANSA001]|uniref:DUF6334 family protein n=1 Tax=unclassified Microbulbifer TaxID=2619833 RepID=UPI00333FDC61
MDVKLSELVESAGILEEVSSYGPQELPGEITQILLRFEHSSCVFCVIDDTDEICLKSFEEGSLLAERTSPTVFHKCIGNKLTWAWEMRNNQGYSDALKFEFSSGVSVELVVMASSIKQYLVSEL